MIAILVLTNLALNLLITHINTSNQHFANNTVSVINNHGGGTGVILNSNPISSSVLTNKHVCQHIMYGGVVMDDGNTPYAILNFRMSNIHDLCQIWVSGDLHGHTNLAESAPRPYDTSVVVGHPLLLPTTITTGHFGQKVMITVSGGSAFPVEAQAVSNVISPGSSGSAVYNDKGELSGMVFAGSGMLSWGMIVPYEYVKLFLETELQGLDVQVITAPPIPVFDPLAGLGDIVTKKKVKPSL